MITEADLAHWRRVVPWKRVFRRGTSGSRTEARLHAYLTGPGTEALEVQVHAACEDINPEFLDC